MLGFTYIGEIYFVGTFVLIWSIYAICTKKYHLIQYLYLNLFMTVILTYMVKIATEIPRPIIGEAITTSFSFPSGHTSIVASMAATINGRLQMPKFNHPDCYITYSSSLLE